MSKTTMTTEAKAWLKRDKYADEIVRVVPNDDDSSPVMAYRLYTSYEQDPEYLGVILFDSHGYWIYDDGKLTIAEQEQLARFIINYKGAV